MKDITNKHHNDWFKIKIILCHLELKIRWIKNLITFQVVEDTSFFEHSSNWNSIALKISNLYEKLNEYSLRYCLTNSSSKREKGFNIKVLGVKHNRVNYSNQVFNTTYNKVCCKIKY